MKSKLLNLGTALSRAAQKQVVGGYIEDPGEAGGKCGSDTEAHCFWIGGSCTNQAYGNCAGQASNCELYCVRPNGTTYYP
ncbi:hypothetical protein [Sediminibacterium sp.]|uniref:hypothetical protein n=1 Tax=Sediminibacterium sp. TaxID=1917865 RepID=UPI0027355A55|nr:hypothetical protein [Sediminibacterium sp.]MDP3394314.1 hypothetical protein [Sediminibacterium sp.]MDP3568149.1 hypothetical protein [Sediminibacterium sp.]